MKAFLFPGQGSQAKGMGKHLFDRYGDAVDRADRILGYSVKELCLSDPRRELNQTQFTQPAIYVVNHLTCLELIERSGQPDCAAGHSLGEFNALLAAGCYDFETGLKLVQRRAQLMSQAAEGAMAAILNTPENEVRSILTRNGLDQIDIANLNTPSQIVISGSKEQIAQAQEHFLTGNSQYIPLNTSGAFHSRLMAPAAGQFEIFLKQFSFAAPKIPVIANVSARPYGADDVAANLARQITSPVRWAESIQHLLASAAAAGASSESEFIEVGHGDVLGKMMQKIRAAWEQEAPRAAAADSLTAQERILRWNRQCPIGTRVRSTVVDAGPLETRTEAVLLFQHRAAVYLAGYNGYFDLAELVAV